MTDECGAPEFFGGGLKLIGLRGEGLQAVARHDRAGDRALFRPCSASGQCRGFVDHAGNRGRHDLPRRRDRGACRDRACARPCGAYGRRAVRQCAGAHECDAGRSHLEGRNRRALLRRHQGRRHGRGGGGVLRSRARGFIGGAAQARRASALEASFPRRAVRRLSGRRLLARRSPATPTRWRTGWRTACAVAGVSIVWPVEANIVFALLPRALDAKLKAAGAAYYVRPNTLAGDDVTIGAGPDAGAAGDVVRDGGRPKSINSLRWCARARSGKGECSMKVAVIGASGRGGSRIVAELARRGHQVTAIARNPEKIEAGPNITVQAGRPERGRLPRSARGSRRGGQRGPLRRLPIRMR